MYINLKKNENLEKTIQDLLRINLPIDIRRYEIVCWIRINLSEYGYLAYVSIEFNELVILSKETTEKVASIDLSDVFNIFDLD